MIAPLQNSRASTPVRADEIEERTMRKLSCSAAVAGLLLASVAFITPAAHAAPITCPGGQTVTKVDGGWQCVNKADHGTNAEDPKNPNAGKNKF